MGAAVIAAGAARAAAGVCLFACLALPPVAAALEDRAATHAAVQIPLLALAGFLVGRALPAPAGALRGWNGNGLPGLVTASGVALVWMLPRALDAAIAEPAVELAKFVSLPLAVGLPLGASWRRLPWLARPFVLVNLVSMLAALGWLYRVAPTRLCNAYRLDDQRDLGTLLLVACVGIGAAGLVRALGACARLRAGREDDALLGARADAMGTRTCHPSVRAALVQSRAGMGFEES